MAKILLAGALFLLLAGAVGAQSNDVEYPTPVREDTITGRIVPRDIGDSRLTQHFYTFIGTPGEMFLRIASENLEGDIDLFLANGLRPLLKISMLAGPTATTVNKIAYIKRREALILRVEARTPDDQPGTYKISFTGAFEVFGGPERTPPPVVASATPAGTPAVRVNSAGARLDPPAPPKPKPTPTPVAIVAKVTPPKPARTPQPKAAPPTATTTSKPEDLPKPPKATEPKPKPATTPRPQPQAPANTTAQAPAKPPVPKPTRPARQPKPSVAQPENAQPPPPTTATAPPATKPPKAKPEPKAKPPVVQTQLVLEFKNGSSVSRAAVRRVTIEKGEIVVVTAEGKVERYSLLEVTKMSVEPSVIQPE